MTKLRKKVKMSQEELAQILGVTKHSVSMYENNKSSPSDKGYMLIAQTFDISLDYLLGLVDEPYSYKRDCQSIICVPKDLPTEVKKLLNDFAEYLWAKHNGHKR